ncbi:MAG: L-threonylcarbamoyladenylate synthase [Planctomycetota bacterium]|jgi:protein-tyrosine phosphatase
MKTQKLTMTDAADTKAIVEVAKMLDNGKLVAVPTETVYGIACKVDRQAIDRLNEVKDRQLGKRYTLHVGNHQQLSRYVPKMSLRNQKLVQNCLPGPLTMVFELDQPTLDQLKADLSAQVYQLLYSEGTLGVRFPDNPVACAIFSAAKSPIVAPSANPAGKDPATNADQVAKYFDGKIDAIVDAPSSGCDYNQSSTVVKVGMKNIEILRQGAVSEEKIQEMSTIRIIFVCTGNTCRSPMAEVFCRKYFAHILGCSIDEAGDFGYNITSAGIAAMQGAPASTHSIEVCQKQGLSLAMHQSSQLTGRQIQESDLIFVMGRSHYRTIVEHEPQAESKCFMLDDKCDIADPIGCDVDVYQQCFEQMKNAIIRRISEII